MITQDELKYLIELKKEGPTLDYKQDLKLEADKDKADFIKDVLALANSGYPSYIVTGIKNKTWEPIDISEHFTQVQLNQILQYRTDPPIAVEYAEIELNGLIHGIVKIFGENPPYLVMVKDKFHSIQKGIVFIRHIDANEGVRRARLDQMYSKVDLILSHNILEQRVTGESAEILLDFILVNQGRMAATFVRASLQFNNISRIKSHSGWTNITALRKNMPAIQLDQNVVHLGERVVSQGIILEVGKDVKEIEAFAQLFAMNMIPKKYSYVISLENK